MDRAGIETKLGITFLLVGLVGYGDYITGEELSFSILYLLPVGYAAWFVGAPVGALVAVASAALWYFVEVIQHAPYSHVLIPIWNALVRLAFFLVAVALVRNVRTVERRLLYQVSARTKSLHAEAVRRRRLERELVEVTAREQRRMAEDLHDGLGQYISALSFHVRLLLDDLRRQESPAVPQAERILALVRTTNRTIRQINRAIRVPEDVAGGLATAIRSLASEFQELTGIVCDVHVAALERRLDRVHVLMLYRIVQEALNNAVKHGGPTAASISGAIVDGSLCVLVADNGRGLGHTSQREPGLGLRTMQLRAKLVGGSVLLRPGPTGGCVLECIMPLSTGGLNGAGGKS